MGDHRSPDVVDELVKLIEEMNPFLDVSGRAFCHVPHHDQAKQGQLPLRDRQVRALLYFRYRERLNSYAGRERVSDAIEFVEGKLLATRRGPMVTQDCPVLRCFLKAVEDHEGGAGSADDVLRMLRQVKKSHTLLRHAERLPPNPTAMGIWMTKNLLLLQAHGIEVTRPPRGSRKRLWGWQKIIRDDDTCDTCRPDVSQGVSLPNPGPGIENRLNDGLTDEEIRILQEAQS